MEESKWLTPEEIAKELKVTRRTVYKWLHEKKLKGNKIESIWRIKRENLERFTEGVK